MGWTFQEIIDATGARRGAGEAAELRIESVATDSRRPLTGSLFVALRGVRHDGHDHVREALHRGAVAALVERLLADTDPARLLVVPDTLRGLGDLAARARQRTSLRVAAVTGSNGKTTTKEMIASICEQAFSSAGRSEVLKTIANENNLVGLPLTLLRLTGEEHVAVLEMGMNAPGEIARLTEIAAPDVGVITNVGPAHLEGLGSVAGVAAAKGELFAGMRPDATIAVNADDEWVARLAAGFPGRRIEFGEGREVQARAIRDFGLDGVGFDLIVGGRTARVRLRQPGSHNVYNALAAAAVTYALGVDVEVMARGLAAAEPPKMRMQVIRLANGVTVLNDGYNANPASTEAALRAVGRQGGRALAVLSEMRELGEHAAALHRRIGAVAARSGVHALIAVGEHAEHTAQGACEGGLSASAIHVCSDPGSAAEIVIRLWRPGDVVLLKGSRGPDDEDVVRLRGSRMAEVARRLEEAGGRRP